MLKAISIDIEVPGLCVSSHADESDSYATEDDSEVNSHYAFNDERIYDKLYS
jgi:hypothetical protein